MKWTNPCHLDSTLLSSKSWSEMKLSQNKSDWKMKSKKWAKKPSQFIKLLNEGHQSLCNFWFRWISEFCLRERTTYENEFSLAILRQTLKNLWKELQNSRKKRKSFTSSMGIYTFVSSCKKQYNSILYQIYDIKSHECFFNNLQNIHWEIFYILESIGFLYLHIAKLLKDVHAT